MWGTNVRDRDDDFSDGCEYSHFIFGRDEAALGSDMGLMYKFDVDIRGFPSGCPGLDTFYPSSHRFSDWTCGIDGQPWDTADPNRSLDEWTRHACPAGCPRQDYKRPDGLGAPGSKAADRDDDFSWGCEYSHFIFGRDETALSVDMGLMYSFDVDLKGFPSGCPGLGGWGPSTP